MQTSERGLRLIEGFEGFRNRQYRDSVGVPTIGYGTTAADVSPLPESCTPAQAEGWLRRHVHAKYEPAISGLGVPLNQNQFDALVSLAYNVGPGVVSFQIGRDLRARHYGAASGDFLHYVYAGGQILQGLVNRRRAERALFNTPVSDKYAGLLSIEVKIFGRTVNELATVKEYDRLNRHPRINRTKLNNLRGDLAFLRDRLRVLIAVDAQQRGRKAALAYSNRGERLSILVNRAGNWKAWTH